MDTITVIGGGIAGLASSIACAEAGRPVRLLEAHAQLGGRARTAPGPFAANLGPHALYADGALWAWLSERDLLPPVVKPLSHGFRFRHKGRLRRTPPAVLLGSLKLLRQEAPVDVDFRTWVTRQVGEHTAAVLSSACGVFAFDADPGRLSAAFVWERAKRAFQMPPAARFVRGGWSTLIDVLEQRARRLGVQIDTGTPVDALPAGAGPVIVATDLRAARRLLGDSSLRTEGASTILLDVGLTARRGDPYIVSDLDEAGWVERFSGPDPTLAPEGHSLLQAQLGQRDDESLDEGVARAERFLDCGYPGWRGREVWRRRSAVRGMSGAIDLPGTTWRDRPAIDRGDGVYLAGDAVAAPGLLAEVALNSAVEAARLAVAATAPRARSGASS